MPSLNIRSKTMFGTSHSWAVTMRCLIDEFIKKEHNCFIISTDGVSLLGDKWTAYLNKDCDAPDIDICYTLPRNFKDRFKEKSKLKLAIYNYETSKMPSVWKDSISDIDYALPSSSFSKKVFVDSGWPEDKCIVIPHGITPTVFLNKEKFKLQNNKKFRFLNISIPHYRKNIDKLVNAYYNAFTNKDDICLVIKTDLTKPSGRNRYKFEADVAKQIADVKVSYKNRKDFPQIEILQERLSDIVPLYNACDSLVSASSSEGFGLPLLEGLAAGLIVIAPDCTGQIDFLNERNSLLVKTYEIKAGDKYQYWTATPGAQTYSPNIDSLSEQMMNAYKNKSLIKKFEKETLETLEKFTWENAAKKILEIK